MKQGNAIKQNNESGGKEHEQDDGGDPAREQYGGIKRI